MSAVRSRVLEDLHRAILSGAPVIVSGTTEDAVLDARQVVSLRAGIRRVFVEAGLPTVAWINAADGVTGADVDHGQRLSGIPAVRGDAGWAASTRGLLACAEQPVAVVLDGPDQLFGEVPLGAEVATIVNGLREARVARGGRLPNALVILTRNAGDVPPALRAFAAMAHIVAPAPSEEERHAVVRLFAHGFYGAATLEAGELDRQLAVIAGATAGRPLVALEQLRRLSVEYEIPITSPWSIVRAESSAADDDWSRRRLGLDQLEDTLGRDVVGQPHALRAVARELNSAQRRSLLRSPTTAAGRPRGWCLLTGNSATGKTELARAIARHITGSEDNIVRLDGESLKLAQDVAKLTGAPPGYIGFEVEGMLAAQIRQRPSCVVLVDEVDKCHPDVLDVFLAILEEGELRGGHAVTSFAETFIVFTSNYGADRIDQDVRTGRLTAPDDVIDAFEAAARHALAAPEDQGGKGRLALWSRLRGRVVGFDMLRRGALPAFVAKADARLAVNSRRDLGLDACLDQLAFVEALDERLPPDGRWDGRRVERLLDELVDDAIQRELDGDVRPEARLVLRSPRHRTAACRGSTRP